MVMIVWQFDLELHVQSVPIATKVESSNLTHGKVYSIHYVIKFVNDLRQVGGRPATPVSSTNKTECHDITEILLIVALNTINLTIKTLLRRYTLFCHL